MGHPFTSVPTIMAKYGKGGTVGFGTLCGALNGAAMAINLVSTDLNMVTEVVGEYTEYEYPSWKPAVTKKTDIDLPTSVSGSALCHISVTKWCEETGYDVGAPERKERCGRLTGEVAGRTAEILNAMLDGTFTAAFTNPESVTGCNGCHGGDGNVANVHSKSDCVQCHGDPHTN